MPQPDVEPLTARNSAGYPSPVGVTADPVVLAPRDGGLHVLLVPRPGAPRRWALPGGFVSPTERPGETAQRKLTEKTGVGAVYLEQLASYAEPRRDPRGWIVSIGHLALISDTMLREAETQARWWAIGALPALAFDHARIVADGVARLRGKLWYSNIAVGLLPERFTLSQARRLYEAISDVAYEPGNFARTLKASGLIEAAEGIVRGGTGRPARLYRFGEQRPQWSSRRSRIPATLRAPAAAGMRRRESGAAAGPGWQPPGVRRGG